MPESDPISGIEYMLAPLYFLDGHAIDSQQASTLLGRLKSSLKVRKAYMEWAMEPVLDQLKPHFDETVHALLAALVSAINFKNNVSVLDDFPVWQGATLL
ncbi:MAG: hypothetical protein GY801_49390 [bacterium]|nr:hypothetical protein [bacterium]